MTSQRATMRRIAATYDEERTIMGEALPPRARDQQVGRRERGLLVPALVPAPGQVAVGAEELVPAALGLERPAGHHHRAELVHEVLGHLVDRRVVALVEDPRFAADLERVVEQGVRAVL